MSRHVLGAMIQLFTISTSTAIICNPSVTYILCSGLTHVAKLIVRTWASETRLVTPQLSNLSWDDVRRCVRVMQVAATAVPFTGHSNISV